jgi:hypothetical protein
MRRAKVVEYRGFCVIQIWELQDYLAAGWASVPFVHISGLQGRWHAQNRTCRRTGLEKCVGDYATTGLGGPQLKSDRRSGDEIGSSLSAQYLRSVRRARTNARSGRHNRYAKDYQSAKRQPAHLEQTKCVADTG